MKSGVISIVGRPNAGKSTLLNSIISRKIAITSKVGGTTRNNIEGIYNDHESQIIFVDTPGIHKPQDKLGKVLNNEAYSTLEGVDLILFVIDITKKIKKGDEFILENLKKTNIPVILVLNKIDLIPYEQALPIIDSYSKIFDFKEIVPLSALKNKNITELINTIKKYLTEGIKIYDEEEVTNISNSFYIEELIREKVLTLTKEEVPHSVTCKIDLIENDNTSTKICASIIIDRENLKKILIGKNGKMIKEIGILSRKEIESYLNTKVYLDLRVKVIEKWRDKDSFLKELGYNNFK